MANFVDPDEVPGFVDPDETPVAAPPQVAAEPAARKRTMTEELMRQLGLTARAGVTGVTGTGAMLADLPVALARAAGAKVPLPSEAQQQLMTRMGLPEPETTTEKVAQLGASMLAGSRDPLMTPFNPPRATAPMTPKQEIQGRSMDVGYKVMPSQVDKDKGALYAMERLAGEPQIRETLREKNAEITTNLVRKALGWPKDAPITAETLDGLKMAIHDEAYAPIDRLGQITTGRVYRQTLNDIERSIANVSDSFPEAARDEIRRLIDGYRVRSFDAADARLAIAHLRERATSEFKRGDSQVGHAAVRVAGALEEAIDMNLAARGERELLTNFRKGRTQFAKIYDIERAMTAPDTVDAIKLATKLRQGAPLSGELRTVAEFGQQFPAMAKLPVGTIPQPLGVARRPKAELIRALPRYMLLSNMAQQRLRPTAQETGPSAARFLPATYNSLMGLFGEPE